MSFQYPECKISPSTAPSGNTFPALLVARETADIPIGASPHYRDKEARRITRAVLDNFWDDIGHTSSSPFLQLLDRGGYNEQARLNRERVAMDRSKVLAVRTA